MLNCHKSALPSIIAGIAFITATGFQPLARSAVLAVDDVTPNPSTTTLSDDLFVGNASSGSLIVDGASDVFAKNGILGHNKDSHGLATITDVGSSWQINDNLVVGNAGIGSLSVLSGGTISGFTAIVGGSPSGSGTMTIDGAGSNGFLDHSLDIGRFGIGELNIVNGGQLTNGFGSIGYAADSAGAAKVGGPNSKWLSLGQLSIGESGSGRVEITQGGYLESGDSFLGGYAGSKGIITLDGARSRWRSQGLAIGNAGSGILKINNGGELVSSEGFVGIQSNSTGRVEVQGTGSKWICSDYHITIGHAGSGTMRIADGGQVDSYSVAVAYDWGSMGEVTVEGMGSSWAINSSLDIGIRGTGKVTQDGGRVDVRGTNGINLGGQQGIGHGTYVLADGILDLHGTDIHGNADNAVFEFTGGILRNVDAFHFDLEQSGGTLAAGDSPGSMEILGDYTLHRGATLEIEIAGAGGAPGIDYDYYDVQGTAVLSGEIDVRLFAGFTPSHGQIFNVLRAESIDATSLTLSAQAGFVVSVVPDSNGASLRITYLPIPEPGSLSLLVLAVIANLPRRLRRR